MRKFIRSIFVCSKRSDRVLSIAVYALLVFGVVVTSSAHISTDSNVKATIMTLEKNIIIAILGIIAYHMVSNYFEVRKITMGRMYALIAVTIALLVGAFIWCYFVKEPKNGCYAWFYGKPFPFDFQPSEIAKITVILIIAVFFCDKRFKGFNCFSWAIWRPIFVFFLIVAIVAFLQKDMGTAFAIGAIGALVFLLPSHRILTIWQVAIVVIITATGFLYVYLLSEAGQQMLTDMGLARIAARFEAVTNPSYASDATREIFYSLLGISKGSLIGVGLGDSVQKFGYLVASDSDYIFAIIAEEMGLIGITIVFAGYFVILWRLLHFSKLVIKEADKAILIGTVCYLFVHFFLNIGGVSGLIPLTGVPLLLISHGGSATLSIMTCLGMSQAVINNYQTGREERRKLIA